MVVLLLSLLLFQGGDGLNIITTGEKGQCGVGKVVCMGMDGKEQSENISVEAKCGLE